MKKRILSSLLLSIVMVTMVSAQSLHEDEFAVVYHMPLTQLAVTIEYDEVTVAPGPFYLYAERYLGTKDVVQEPQTRYEVTTIRMAPHTIADPNRSFNVLPGIDQQLLSLTSEGMLYGYNVPTPSVVPAEAIATELPKAITNDLMPLMEEQLVASSIAKMAEGAAKQIYHIRETRMNILAGDVEHVPADGMSMQLVLNELDKREKALAELFIGTKNVVHHSYTIYYTPNNDVKDVVIARVSRFAGVVANEDLSGEPIRLTLKGQRQELLPMEFEETKKKVQAPSQIYYNLPGSADITLQFAGKTVAQAKYIIAQYGVAVPLAKNIFTTKQLPKIYFNTQTGNILSIQK